MPRERRTLQCSHLFLTALPTFMPLVWPCAALSMACFCCCVVGVARHAGRLRMVENARAAVCVAGAVARMLRRAGRVRRREAIVWFVGGYVVRMAGRWKV